MYYARGDTRLQHVSGALVPPPPAILDDPDVQRLARGISSHDLSALVNNMEDMASLCWGPTDDATPFVTHYIRKHYPRPVDLLLSGMDPDLLVHPCGLPHFQTLLNSPILGGRRWEAADDNAASERSMSGELGAASGSTTFGATWHSVSPQAAADVVDSCEAQ